MAIGKINELFRDAIELEINSILVDGITGRNMPGTAAAFLEIISAWAHQFGMLIDRVEGAGIKIIIKDYPIVGALETWNDEKKLLFRNYVLEQKSFDALAAEKTLTWILNIDTMRRFRRFVNNAVHGKKDGENIKMELFRLQKLQTRLMVLKDKLGTMLKEQPGGGEPPVCRETQELRKMWELKDGYIFAQSIVQLDGDVISRYNSKFFRDKRLHDRTTELLEFHQKNVGIGLSHWHLLFEMIMKIAKDIGEKIVSPFK
jgi:hypothetical protein